MHPLVTTALLGTGQKKLAPTTAETPLDSLLATLPEGEQERTLLLQAGTRALYRQAGYRPGFLASIPEPAAPETQPVCSAKKSAALSKILREAAFNLKLPLLLEVLQSVSESDEILPPELLPALLNLREDSHTLRHLLAATCGTRGLWLSQLNPNWLWLSNERLTQQNSLPADCEAIWQTGSPFKRIALLALLRRIDPTQARARLQATWSGERAETRNNLLKTFQTGLSKADEDFLETCLDDRSTSVRATAASLLNTLPDAALTQRMRERASALLTFQPPDHLALHFRTTLTSAEERDGLVLPKKTQTITQSSLLSQIISHVSPDFWLTHFGVDSETLIWSAGQTQWSQELLAAWTSAALLYKTESWYQPLWSAWMARLPEKNPEDSLGTETYHELATRLPAAFLEAEIARHPVNSEVWRLLLPLLHKPLSRQMVESAFQAFQHEIEVMSNETKTTPYPSLYDWNTLLEQIALGWPGDSFDIIPARFVMPTKTNYSINYMQNYFRNFRRIINIRRSLFND